MIVKNKRTRETLDITLEEFKKRFAKEIEDSLESYKRSVLAKPTFPPFKINNTIEGDFYFSLRYNFNNHGISNWYIEKI
jgi:hypothetical protein